MNNIGQRLKDLRQEKELTQNQLAQILNVNRSLIAQYENEITTPSSEMVIKLAVFFDTTTDYILGLENEVGAKTKLYENIVIEEFSYDDGKHKIKHKEIAKNNK